MDSLKKEVPIETSKQKINSSIDKVTAAFEKSLKFDYNHLSLVEYYYQCCESVFGLDYGLSEVSGFTTILTNYQDLPKFNLRAGLFYAALVNNFEIGELTVFTDNLEKKLDCIGFKNKNKNIVVQGNAGFGAGYFMHSGSLAVNGNAGCYAGAYLEDGIIEIKGNCNYGAGSNMYSGSLHIAGECQDVGFEMFGGKILVDKFVSGYVGEKMRNGFIEVNEYVIGLAGWQMYGGIIKINGEFTPRIHKCNGGKIYHKGRLCMKDGHLLI